MYPYSIQCIRDQSQLSPHLIVLLSFLHFFMNTRETTSRGSSLKMSSGSSSPPSYEPIHGKEERDSIDGLDMLPLPRARTTRRGSPIKAAMIISALVLVAFIILTFALSFHAVDLLGKIGHLINEPKPASHQRSYKYPCGQTATEAKEKGCIFDIMSMAWSVFPMLIFFRVRIHNCS